MSNNIITYVQVELFRMCFNHDSQEFWVEYDAGDGVWERIEGNELIDVILQNPEEAKALTTALNSMMHN